jgi:hypothetical protein
MIYRKFHLRAVYTEGLAKSERSKDFGAEVGDKENSHVWLFS